MVALCVGFAVSVGGMLPVAAVAASTQASMVALPDFTPIVKQYGPAVVNISTTETKVAHGAGSPFPPNSPLNQFFAPFFGAPGQPGSDQGGGAAPSHKYQVQSLGSGFIVSADGYIVTAAHVVKGAQKIIVSLTNHHQYTAHLVGLSTRMDVALLKIDANNLPTVQIGDSGKLEVGQWVLAVGSPFGFENSVTQGVVSATARPLPDDPYIPFIQTDVPINPGNSGGPLFNMRGQVIGINDQIYTNSGGYMGLSFSIPINVAMDAVKQLKLHQKVHFGWLGVMIQDVSMDLAKSFHMKEPIGALVSQVVPDGPAAKAGLRPGDVIISFDGHAVYNSGQLPPMVGALPAGFKAKLGIIRDGKPMTLNIVVESLPGEMDKGTDKTAAPDAQAQKGEIKRLNIEVGPLTAEARKQLNVNTGVLVLGVASGVAAEAGIRPGDVILQVAQQPVNNVSTLQKLVASLPAEQPVPVLVRRGDGSFYIVLSLPR
ncbi:DegQ family serine endoprotease [Acidithiobacillus concretivorus]|uniref:Probable periplasmic serine endoprotease DegP-like n=1 Tax=Acidithiobacillus concretivorus TaxID=3063952 RepID=A0ABS5ZLX0_9PROT|nr:DegQ family serine endoprotease [Acidithiobacillus concretivorus]MBU2737638.1 DegQ family serine endoprotease [Acidithiobacillus concretivorus]